MSFQGKNAENRDEKRFAATLRRHQLRLHGYIHSLVRDLNDTDDVFQQTTLVLWRKFSDFDPESSFLAWACGIARWEVANFLRSRARRRLYFSDHLNLLLAEAQEEIADDELADRQAALGECIDRLRERDRQLLAECYSGANQVNDVAERRGRSPQSVYNSLRRIRRALYSCIERTVAQQTRPEWSP